MGQLEQSETNRDERGVTVSVVPPVDHYQLSGACLWVCTEQLDHTCCYIETIVFCIWIYLPRFSYKISDSLALIYLSLSFLFSIRKLSQFYLNDSSVDKEVCSYYISKTTLSFV